MLPPVVRRAWGVVGGIDGEIWDWWWIFTVGMSVL